MQAGRSPVQVGEFPSIGPVVIELGGIPVTETSEVVYLREILTVLKHIDSLLNQSIWERMKRWLGIH